MKSVQKGIVLLLIVFVGAAVMTIRKEKKKQANDE